MKKRRFIGGLLAFAMLIGVLPHTVFAADAALPTISGSLIYANGTAVIIAEEDSGTTVYIDANSDGVLDAGELSLADAGITDAPADGADLSAWTINGGYQNTALDGGTKITMTGGNVKTIRGGGSIPAATVVNTNVLISGGTVGTVYGGGYEGNVTGTANVEISGTANITYDVYGGSELSSGTSNATMVKISGGTVSRNVYGGGSNGAVTTANVDISGGMVYEDVFGGGYSGAVTTANVTISGGVVGYDESKDYVYAAGYTSSASVVDATISITGGTVRHIVAEGFYGNVTNSVAITVTGGTVLNSVNTEVNSSITKSVTVGGSVKIGNAAKDNSGIIIYGPGEDGIETFKIEPALTADAKIYVRGRSYNSVLTAGETVATDAVATDVQYIEVSNNLNNLSAYFDAATNEIKLGTKPEITLNPAAEITYVKDATRQTPIEVASSTAGATFQWYSNTLNNNTGGTPILGATSHEYLPDAATTGTTYYYCVITDPATGLSAPTNTSKVDIEEIAIIDGDNRTVTRGQAHTFTSNDAYTIGSETPPITVYLGAFAIDASNYTKREGSIIVTLSSAYTNTLSLGEHTLSIMSANGTATTTINVVAAPVTPVPTNPVISPDTGVYN